MVSVSTRITNQKQKKLRGIVSFEVWTYCYWTFWILQISWNASLLLYKTHHVETQMKVWKTKQWNDAQRNETQKYF